MKKQYMDNYSTHLPMLVAAVMRARKPVIELGMGEYSTPILRELCLSLGVELLSVETSAEWFQRFAGQQNQCHRMVLVRDWSELHTLIPAQPLVPWGVAFVDNGDNGRDWRSRGRNLGCLANSADYLVAHDTEDGQDTYGYNSVGGTFKAAYTDDARTPWTTVFSNFHACDFGPGLKKYVHV